jgi:hypothetical protein
VAIGSRCPEFTPEPRFVGDRLHGRCPTSPRRGCLPESGSARRCRCLLAGKSGLGLGLRCECDGLVGARQKKCNNFRPAPIWKRLRGSLLRGAGCRVHTQRKDYVTRASKPGRNETREKLIRVTAEPAAVELSAPGQCRRLEHSSRSQRMASRTAEASAVSSRTVRQVCPRVRLIADL